MHSLGIIPVIAASVSAMLLMVIWKFVPSNFLAATVNARSNHQKPTRQLGGFAVVPAVCAALLWAGANGIAEFTAVIYLMVAALLLFMTGAIDDARDLSPVPKFILQLVAAGIVAYGLQSQFPAFTFGLVPIASVAVAIFVLVWAINLTNFMDGLDLIVVAGIGTPALVLGLGGLMGAIDIGFPIVLALALGAALLPFAMTNRPPASLFLGDNGSLPIGLFAGVIGLGISAQYSIFAGLLPFAYFVIDSAATLLQRIFERKNIFAAHSEHAYQIARRAGVPALTISIRVGAVSSATSLAAILIANQTVHPMAGFVAGYGVAIILFLMLKKGR